MKQRIALSLTIVSLLVVCVVGNGVVQGHVKSHSNRLELLTASLIAPKKRVSATIKVKEPLDELMLSQVDLEIQVTTLWIGEVIDGELRTSNQPVREGDAPLNVFLRHREFTEKMSSILESTKPSPDIDIPKTHDFGVYGFSVLGTPAQVLRAGDKLPQAEIVDVSPEGKPPLLLPSTDSAPTVVAQADTSKQFLPNRGSITIQQLQPGYRYVLNWFYWDGSSTLSGFASDEAYEHETVLNKYDGRAYLGTSVNWDGSFSSKYLDTQTLNNLQEPDWTVGCYRAKETFRPGTWYYCWIVTDEGNTSADAAKLSGEAKVRFCDFSPWCVTGSQRGYGRMIPAWYMPAPGSQSWYKAPVLSPQITDINPKTIPVGVDRVLTIDGKNFAQTFGAKVIVNGQIFPIYPGSQTRFVSADQVQLTVKIGSSSSPSTSFSVKTVNIVDGENGHEELDSQPFNGLTAVGSSSSGGGVITTLSGSVAQSQWWSGSFSMPSGLSSSRVTLIWSGSADLDLHLISSDGSRYGFGENQSGYSGYWTNPEIIQLSSPRSGSWQIRVYGWSVSGTQNFTVRVE